MIDSARLFHARRQARCSAVLFLAALAAAAVMSAPAPPAAGQTIIIDRPPPMPPVPPRRPWPMRDAALGIRKIDVNVAITDGAATTTIDQTFHNRFDRTVEGTFIYPLDDDVSVSRYTMEINGQEVEGKLLSVEEARRTYEEIVARMRDPSILEYVGRKSFQARIFPIGANSDVRVRLTYSQMLKSDAGLVSYRYPLDVDKYIADPVEQVSVLAKIDSKVPIQSVFSPSHKIGVTRKTPNQAIASFEEGHMRPDRDFELFYSLADKEFGLTMLTYRPVGEDGYFLARISPPAAVDAKDVVPKDIAFVLDTSGSMGGGKIEQAKQALKFCLRNLNDSDRFNVIPFSHEAVRFADALKDATGDNVKAAVEFVDGLKAIGGTNINDALLAALSDAPKSEDSGEAADERPYYIVFLTDGQPTVSVTDPEEILANVSKANTRETRVFVFGVGENLNAKLLDLIAEKNGGTREYVEDGQDLELVLSSFYRKIADPVLGDLELKFSDLRVYDLYPPRLGDLFSGMEIVLTGRYHGQGDKAIELTGARRGKEEKFIFEAGFPETAKEHDFLPALWATRKVGYLLDEIRLHGEDPELKSTIVQLAMRYGIITPYTAYLVTEPDQVARRGAGGRGQFDATAARALRELGYVAEDGDSYGQDSSGAAAVRRSREAGDMKQANAPTPPPPMRSASGGGGRGGAKGGARPEEREVTRFIERVGDRTFYFADGKWTDGGVGDRKPTRQVTAFSPEYFELIRKHPELAACFALGERVIVAVGGEVYETLPAPVEEKGDDGGKP